MFSDAHPLTDEEAADQWALICHNGGRTLGHRLIHYLDERERYASAGTGRSAIGPGPQLRLGPQDPVATTAVLEALIELRPHAPVERLRGLGHYPQLEDPAAIAAAVNGALLRVG